MRLQAKRALVTGASKGIGEAVARALAAEGVKLFLVARGREALEPLARELQAGWGLCDVSQEDSVQTAVAAAREHLGGVDILVNNAGVSSSSPLGRLTVQEWERVHGINSTGTFLCTRAVIDEMTGRGWGRVVNLASVAGLVGGRYITAYSASKHAVLGFTRSLALEVAARGVTVNAVCPGYVDTPMSDRTVENVVKLTGRGVDEARQTLERTNPQNRLFTPEEVAYAVVFLCHPLAAGVNGHALMIDGGAPLG